MKKFDKELMKENTSTDELGVFEPSFISDDDFWVSVAKSWTSYRISSETTLLRFDPLAHVEWKQEDEKV